METSGCGDGRPVCDGWLQGGEMLAVGACVRPAGVYLAAASSERRTGSRRNGGQGYESGMGTGPVVELGTADGRVQGT